MHPGALPLTEIALRLFVATTLGVIIGWEREYHRKPAGLRTHTLVALGAATFMLISLDGHMDLAAPAQAASADPNRVLQGVVGGIGFLGAGSILQARGHVSGLTTAASVWLTGALGAGAGVGAFALVGMATAIGFVVLTVLHTLEDSIKRKNEPPT